MESTTRDQANFDKMMGSLPSMDPMPEVDILMEMDWTKPLPELKPTDIDIACGKRQKKETQRCFCVTHPHPQKKSS